MQTLKYMFVAMIAATIIAIISILRSQNNESSFVSATEIDNTIFNDRITLCHNNTPEVTDKWDTNLPIIYFVTPTYPRREQIPELTRLGQTLMHVKNLRWIVADDNEDCNPNLIELLKKFGIPLTLMSTPMPKRFKKKDKTKTPRGVANRQAALDWIRSNADSGVLYFGDDDNTFDLEMFEEIRYTKKVSMLPVGLIGEFGVSSPVVKEGKVIGFFDSWAVDRKFPIDMAGFAVSVEFLNRSPNANMPYRVGYEEDIFLKSLGLDIEDIEPLANNCTKILVWHTQTTKKQIANLKLVQKETGTSLDELLNELYKYGVASRNNEKGIKTYYVREQKRTEV